MSRNVVIKSNSPTTLIDAINTYTIIYGYAINNIWYRSGWFRTTYFAELIPPVKPPLPPPKLFINIGPVSNRISLEPKVKLKLTIGPVSVK